MTHLDLCWLSNDKADELGEEEKRFVDALLHSSLTQLKFLDLSENKAWFKHEESREYLIEFIKRQTKLNTLKLFGNDLNGSEAAKDLRSWRDESATTC